MKYSVKRIENENQIESCNRFEVDKYLWNSKQEPTVYGWMGYLENQGLFVKMVCEEKEPKCTYTKPNAPVCFDSSMEIFLAFPEENEEINNECMYTNFEINALGTMLANYGRGREKRKRITNEHYRQTKVRTPVEESRWYLEVLFPEDYLKTICNIKKLKNGSVFYCNFYKISEDEKLLHYGCFSPIKKDYPDFYLPIFFSKAYIER